MTRNVHQSEFEIAPCFIFKKNFNFQTMATMTSLLLLGSFLLVVTSVQSWPPQRRQQQQQRRSELAYNTVMSNSYLILTILTGNLRPLCFFCSFFSNIFRIFYCYTRRKKSLKAFIGGGITS